jgi:hypothetical protein
MPSPLEQLRAVAGLSSEEQSAIAGGNAAALLRWG